MEYVQNGAFPVFFQSEMVDQVWSPLGYHIRNPLEVDGVEDLFKFHRVGQYYLVAEMIGNKVLQTSSRPGDCCLSSNPPPTPDMYHEPESDGKADSIICAVLDLVPISNILIQQVRFDIILFFPRFQLMYDVANRLQGVDLAERFVVVAGQPKLLSKVLTVRTFSNSSFCESERVFPQNSSISSSLLATESSSEAMEIGKAVHQNH
jgi:hypothetical protein